MTLTLVPYEPCPLPGGGQGGMGGDGGNDRGDTGDNVGDTPNTTDNDPNAGDRQITSQPANLPPGGDSHLVYI